MAVSILRDVHNKFMDVVSIQTFKFTKYNFTALEINITIEVLNKAMICEGVEMLS